MKGTKSLAGSAAPATLKQQTTMCQNHESNPRLGESLGTEPLIYKASCNK